MEEANNYKSRTKKKNEFKALRNLGLRLVSLGTSQIRNIQISEDLLEAILFAKNLKRGEAKRRQQQYIGTLMKDIDPEPIQHALKKIDIGIAIKEGSIKNFKKWRDDLMNGNKDLLEELIAKFPDAQRQRLRQLVRNAEKEREKNKSQKSSNALLQYLNKLHG